MPDQPRHEEEEQQQQKSTDASSCFPQSVSFSSSPFWNGTFSRTRRTTAIPTSTKIIQTQTPPIQTRRIPCRKRAWLSSAERWKIFLLLLLLYQMQYFRKAELILFPSTLSSLVDTDDGFSQPTFTKKSKDTDDRFSQPMPTKKSKVFHVLNIYATNKGDTNDPIHQPYNQWAALKSIERAKLHLPHNLEVTVICAMLQSDMEVLSENMVPACDRRVQLNRSTITEYGKNSTPSATASSRMEEQVSDYFSELEVPFVQDLLDEAVLVAREQSPGSQRSNTDKNDNRNDEDFYIMLTNSDIGLTKNFYKFLLPELQKGRKAFQINRLTIPMSDAITVRKATTDPTEVKTLLAQIDASIPKGKKHPGHDCFFIHSSIIDQVFLGKMFLGFPPWANALKLIFRDILVRGNYKMIESNPSGTFHLGDDRAWKKTQEHKAKSKFIQTKYQEEIAHCPVPLPRRSNNPRSYLNLATCGASFREHYPYLLQQVQGARCHYCLPVGWVLSNDASCKEFRLGRSAYPWESTRRVYNVTGYNWKEFQSGGKQRVHCDGKVQKKDYEVA